MPGSIENTLRELNSWFDELPGGVRPKLLSKLATLELCCWIETYIDVLIEKVGILCGFDDTWIKDNITNSNYGFSYNNHLRPMLIKLIGEMGVKSVETNIEKSKPGMLDQLKSELGSLWKARGHLAHSPIVAPLPQQTTINAPSWSLNRQRIIEKNLDILEKELEALIKTIAP